MNTIVATDDSPQSPQDISGFDSTIMGQEFAEMWVTKTKLVIRIDHHKK